uniref:Cytochrome c oxidase subunit 2 n=1 Tax=Colossendeis brevirostris TaxID=619823 RepID=A0A9E8AEA6_9CHEL|nr:cytochrome c oxidase subunit 2 [Colossendeis brevirostris]UYX57804.1 cytochrome c oxidase subunit 2 [Colossendeis brevirostris]
MPTWNHIMLQNSSNPSMEQLIMFHDHSMLILFMICIFIIYMMLFSMMNKNFNYLLLQGQEIETIWTMAPAIILLFITIPSLKILYMMEEIFKPFMTIKAIGHQWYWSYEYSDFKNIEFDSFMINDSKLMRLLDVDNRVMLPFNTPIRILVTSADVIHSWSIPSMGLKMDATPGRINQMFMNINRPGIYSGQCSEICGANHSFMPIMIEAINMNNFFKWIMNF